jgi:predicted acyl esterase
VSGLQAFESPDPGFWCDQGYAIAYVDAAGTSRSGGDEVFWGSASGRNVYDAVEWLAAQSWSTGKVGMAGNSQLAMVQWAAAALQPPHLAAIAPWEGLIDCYREVIMRGGIPDTKFHDEDIVASLFGENDSEDVTAHTTRFPLMNAYWADKRADLASISLPAYVVASWTSVIHCHGTLQAFREISSAHKWLRVHNTQEWIDLADADRIADLQRFFDRFLKGIDNGWEDTPRVRLFVLDPGGTDVVDRPADDLTASVTFATTFDHDVEITGYLNLHLWVEAADADDMDLFAAVYKESPDGKRQHHFTMPAPSARAFTQSLERDGKLPGTLSYTGPLGRLRVSHRALDPDRSTPSEPYLTHQHEDLLTPGETVAVELSLWPAAMILHAGERLVVEIAGHPAGPPAALDLPGAILDLPTRNRGTHRIRTGGTYDSHLLLPVVP